MFSEVWSIAGSAAAPFMVPVWVAVATAALFAAACVLALRKSRLAAAVALLGIVLAIAALSRANWHDPSAERRALEARGAELTNRALLPGSAFACLDAGAGEAIETACEKTVFARPENAAAAVAYVAARIELLADALDLAKRGDAAYAGQLAGLRRAIELDRYGITAHVLATREGCSPDDCPAFALLRDAGAVKANLKARAFDKYVARYAPVWAEKPEPQEQPVAAVPAPATSVQSSTPYEFPSAASIPPVSIMNAEPKEAPAAQAAPAKPAAAPTPPKRPQNQAEAPPAR